MPDQRPALIENLRAFQEKPFREASLEFFRTLGWRGSSRPLFKCRSGLNAVPGHLLRAGTGKDIDETASK